MITFLIIYLIGVVIAYFLVAYGNDLPEHKNNKAELWVIQFSWIVVIIALLTLLFIHKPNIFTYKPSLKSFKSLFKKK